MIPGQVWLDARERAAATRRNQGRRRTDRPPGAGPVPPPCNTPLARGWCVLAEGHRAGHLPLPACYPPAPTVIKAVS